MLFLATLINNNLHAQKSISVENLDLSGNLEVWYDQSIGYENTSLQTGVLADTEKKSNNSHPYLSTFRWQEGTITYRDQTFYNVPVLYNIEQDILLTRETGISYLAQHIMLNTDQVSSFNISNLLFRNINEFVDSYTTGFFEVLYESPSLYLIAKRTKVLEISSEKQFVYINQDRYYLRTEDQYYRIKHLADIKHLFKEHRHEINRFLRNKIMRIGKENSDQELVSLIQYCNDLVTSDD